MISNDCDNGYKMNVNTLKKVSLTEKYPSYCCQQCGAGIGWLGRFFQFLKIPLHNCEIKK